MGYPILGCPCRPVDSTEFQSRSMSPHNGNNVNNGNNNNNNNLNGNLNGLNGLYNKRFENGPHDVVLVGGNGNGDPVL